MVKPRNDHQGIVLPSAFIYSLRLLEFLHPYLAMRLALFFFAKPLKYQFLERETPVFSKAEKSTVHILSLKKSVFCYHWQGKGAKIMLMHGWSGRATNFFKIIEKLMVMDYDIYAFDAPAHGKSRGIITNLPEFILILDTLLNQWGPFEAILGHSGGGFSSAHVCAYHPEIKKLILISPFDKSIDIFENYFHLIGLGEKARGLMLDYFFKITKKKISEFSTSFSACSIQTNTLIIHDEIDREVALYNAVNIYKGLKKGRLIITKGLGHRRILRDDRVVDEIFYFLNN
jgi:alpha-beta hydrolase superfamily lysophospholipase